MRCQGFHACRCIPARFVVERLDLRSPAQPAVTEALCRGCLSVLERDGSFVVVVTQELVP